MKRKNLRKPSAFWSNGFKSAAEIEKTGTYTNILNDTSNSHCSKIRNGSIAFQISGLNLL